jgi:SH3-like domain-containing protein
VVTASAASVKKTPAANSSEEFVIHEGTRVDIIDDTMKEWKCIRLADGKEGWILTSQMEKT